MGLNQIASSELSRVVARDAGRARLVKSALRAAMKKDAAVIGHAAMAVSRGGQLTLKQEVVSTFERVKSYHWAILDGSRKVELSFDVHEPRLFGFARLPSYSNGSLLLDGKPLEAFKGHYPRILDYNTYESMCAAARSLPHGSEEWNLLHDVLLQDELRPDVLMWRAAQKAR
ncbi:MAG: hypothetical protein JWM80_415 [Cyanobacteria bacterium RYN_339]|nr:hypothetical protein [Cyanobacteria bacterium RYN_339]